MLAPVRSFSGIMDQSLIACKKLSYVGLGARCVWTSVPSKITPADKTQSQGDQLSPGEETDDHPRRCCRSTIIGIGQLWGRFRCTRATDDFINNPIGDDPRRSLLNKEMGRTHPIMGFLLGFFSAKEDQ